MYGLYKGVDINKASVYDDLMERMTVAHYRFLLIIVLIEIITSIVMFFSFESIGELSYPPLTYWLFYLVIPSGINIIVAIICYYILKGANNTNTGVYAVSFSLLIICGCIYMVHNVFEPVIILLGAPMIISCVYGNKRLTGLLCLGDIVSKLGLDYLKTMPQMPSYYAYSNKIEEYGILNYVIFLVISVGIMGFCFNIINVEKEKRTLIEQLEQERNTADSMAQKEKYFRKKLSDNKILEYVANVNTNTFVDGKEIFEKLTEGENLLYSQSMTKLLKSIVHPEDISVFEDFNDVGYFEYRQLHSPRYSLRVRVSTTKVLAGLILDEDVTLRLLSKDKDWFYISFNANIVRDPEDGSLLLHVNVQDVDDLVEKEQELKNELSLDALTGIFNRKTAEKKVGDYITRKLSGSLFMMDLDGFKAVNDNLGHPEGDRILIETASIIKDAFRADDVTCRLGGDEFLIFAPGVSEQMALEKGNYLIQVLTRTVHSPKGLAINLGASIGLAFYPEDADNYEDLYSKADMALYEAKKAGKGRVVLYKGVE